MVATVCRLQRGASSLVHHPCCCFDLPIAARRLMMLAEAFLLYCLSWLLSEWLLCPYTRCNHTADGGPVRGKRSKRTMLLQSPTIQRIDLAYIIQQARHVPQPNLRVTAANEYGAKGNMRIPSACPYRTSRV
jgi:hypothetical protein